MFDQLVVSSRLRRKHTTAKFFVGTSAIYIMAVACAFLVSIVLSDPKLADTAGVLTQLVQAPPGAGEKPPRNIPPTRTPESNVRPDSRHVMDLETLMSHRRAAPPAIPNIDRGPGGPGSPLDGPGPGSSNVGVPFADRTVEPPPTPDPPRPRPAPQPTVADNRPLRVPSTVLQGKAIERRTPPYPQIPKLMKLQDTVSVEVIISPEGQVESARAVSGHPLFRKAAEDAARGWRFEPTLLNKVPVRVTGVITFVFKLSE